MTANGNGAGPLEPEPPQNLDAEEHVLGALMCEGAPRDQVLEILAPHDFYRGSHSTIYRAITALHLASEPVDPITVNAHLQRTGEIDTIPDGPARVYELHAIVPAASNAPHYARLIAQAARSRDLIRVGTQIARIGWDGADDAVTMVAQAGHLVANLGDRNANGKITVESWRQFESQATDRIPTLIDGLWPENAFGFIAAPPEAGKTWVALYMALCLATGKPFLGQTIPKPQPVIYLALEGHRAALRARIGCLARGLDLNPDDPDTLHNLHLIYKPEGINLTDIAWAYETRKACQNVRAAILIVDVLRAAARIKENDQAEFTALRHNLQPISNDGTSIAILHHFAKLTETSKERQPGERMSGTGAMFGALDAAIYITGSTQHARRLRLEFDSRDLAGPETLTCHIEGQGTGDNGGFTYRDAATITLNNHLEGPDPDDLKASAAEIAAYVDGQGGTVAAKYVCAYFDISDKTLYRRTPRLHALGIDYTGGRGKPGQLTRRQPSATTNINDDQMLIESSDTDKEDTVSELRNSGTLPHNKAKTDSSDNIGHETRVLNENMEDAGETDRTSSPPLRGAPASARMPAWGRAAAHTYARASEDIQAGLWMDDNLPQTLATTYPDLDREQLRALIDEASQLAATELGG